MVSSKDLCPSCGRDLGDKRVVIMHHGRKVTFCQQCYHRVFETDPSVNVPCPDVATCPFAEAYDCPLWACHKGKGELK